MTIVSAPTRRLLYVLVGVVTGMVFNSYLQSLSQRGRALFTNEALVSPQLSKTIESNGSLSTNFTIDYHNIDQFYEEFYRFYELNKEC